MSGFFITIEGGEGAGKTAQANALTERLSSAYGAEKVWRTREPGGTPLANAIRAVILYSKDSLNALARSHLAPAEDAEELLPITELLLYTAARAQNVIRIQEELQKGNIVLSDRFTDATYAYQGQGRGVPTETIADLEQLATKGLHPDLTILLDIPAAEGLRRKAQQAQRIDKQQELRTQPSMNQLTLFQAHSTLPEARKNRVRAKDLEREINRFEREELSFHRRVREGYLKRAAAEPTRIVKLDATLPASEVARLVWEAVQQRLPSGF